MAKELFISSSPHEMKVAVLEDDQLVEVYHERDTDVGLVGGIYKGRVSRVLPGMQSAFVNIGLDRDAFLYVSDFFLEDMDDYDKLIEETETRTERPIVVEAVLQIPQRMTPATEPAGERPPASPLPARPVAREPVAPPPAHVPVTPPPREVRIAPPVLGATPAMPFQPTGEHSGFRRHEGRGRRRRRPIRGFEEPAFVPRSEPATSSSFEVLPGESLAKHSRVSPEHTSSPTLGTRAAQDADDALTAPTPNDQEIETSSFPPETTEPATAEQSEFLPEGHVAEASGSSTEAGATETWAQEPPVTPIPADAYIKAAAESIPWMIKSPGRATPPEESEKDEVTLASQPEPVNQESFPAASVETPAYEDESSSDAAEAEAATEELTEELEPEEYPPTPDFEAGAPGAEPNGLATELTEESAEGEDFSEEDDAAAVLGSPGALLAGVAEGATSGEPQSEITPAPTAPAGTSAGPAPERTYTMREPHQRPRFAPRRGRRGQRGTRRPFPQDPARPAAPPPQISQLLKEGQEILVQIAKEPLGTKGARITSHVALPGRYLVFMPTIHHIGISRRISDEGERLRLRRIILENKGSLNGGFIVRTAGEGRSEDEFKADLKFLTALWNDIRSKAENSKAPALIHRDLDLIQRLLRDMLSPDFKSVRVDSEIDYERVLDFVNQCQPSLVGHVRLYTRDTPLFEEFGIQAEIEKALRPKVWLKSGGYIVINQTEALVAVDVNTGKYVGKTNRLEDTILKTNVDAVNEIVRQLRLRDLGGIIIIDFIDMEERKNRHKVVQVLEEALRRDRAPTKVIAFNDFGLVAITRKRVRQSLERTLCEPCSYCTGSGWVKSVKTVCYEILAEVRKMAGQIEGNSVTLRVNPEVGKALKAREGLFIAEMESLTHKDVIIKNDPTVTQERFEIF